MFPGGQGHFPGEHPLPGNTNAAIHQSPHDVNFTRQGNLPPRKTVFARVAAWRVFLIHYVACNCTESLS